MIKSHNQCNRPTWLVVDTELQPASCQCLTYPTHCPLLPPLAYHWLTIGLPERANVATQLLTKASVDALRARPSPYFAWDAKLKGFGVKVNPSSVNTPQGRKVYVVQYRPKARRASTRVTLGAHGALTVEQARRLAQEMLGNVAAGHDPAERLRAAKDAPTIVALAPRFIARHGTLVKPTTAAWIQGLFDTYILPQLGTRRVADLSTSDVAGLHEALSKTPYQANRVVAVLSVFCKWAESEGYRPGGSNPCRAVRKFKERNREYFMSGDELARLGAILREAETVGLPPTDTARAGFVKRGQPVPERVPVETSAVEAIRLLLFTGCRKSEILGLRWKEVDLQRKQLVLGNTKTGQSNRPLNAAAAAVLARIPRHLASEFVFPGLDPMTPRLAITTAWNRVRTAAGLDKARLHDIRHTYATVAVSGGASLVLTGGLLGHTQASTTQRYAHLANDPLALAAERAGQDMEAAMSGTITPVTPLHRRNA